VCAVIGCVGLLFQRNCCCGLLQRADHERLATSRSSLHMVAAERADRVHARLLEEKKLLVAEVIQGAQARNLPGADQQSIKHKSSL
jgi:hypothetical protein